MKKLPISVTIITKNEEDRLPQTLESVKDWVAEMVVVDSGSDDATVDVAKNFGAKTYHRDWTGYGEQKYYAEDVASHDWVLNLDADERVLPELRDEIMALFENEDAMADGYFMNIHDRFHGTDRLSKYVPFDAVRLYRKSKGRYSTSPVHDRVQMHKGSTTARLKGRLAHDSLRSFAHAIDKTNRYTTMQVADMQAKGRKFSALRLLLEFPLAFFKGYFVRGYWREGLIGYIYAVNFAYGRFLRQAKLWEAAKKIVKTNKSI